MKKKKRTYEEFLADTLVPEEEWPHPIPENWRWVRLGEVSTYAENIRKLKGELLEEDTWVLDLEDIEARSGKILRYTLAGEKKITGDRCKFSKGQILFCKLRPYLQKILVAPEDGIGSSELIPFDGLTGLSPEYLVFALKSPWHEAYINYNTNGTRMPRAKKETMTAMPIPLPPLAEQQAIARVLEEAFDRLDEAREHLEAVVEGAEHRRASLLHQAMTGKLSADFRAAHPEDAGELLERIRDERAALVKAKKLKKTTFAPIEEEDIPHPIPENWRWVRLGEVSTYESNSVQPAKYPDKIFELYSVPSFQEGYPEIVPGNEIGSSKQGVQKGDVLLCKINPRINRVWRVTQFTEHELCASSEWIVIRNPHISPEYLVHALSEEHFRNLLTSNVSGVGGSLTRAQPKQVKTYPIPLPPLAEQREIAQHLEEFFEKEEEMVKRGKETLRTIDLMKKSLLARALRGELVPQSTDDVEELIQRIYEEAQ